jgi:hypothetical protein
MLIKKIFSILVITGLLLSFTPSAGVRAEDEAAGDESATFTSSNAPDALIILDLSGSMDFNPAGDDGYPYGSSLSCAPDTANCQCTH